jgi:hypothetical protein
MSIALSCTACGEVLLPADRFCIQCGAPTTGGTPAAVRPSHSRIELLHRLEQVTRGVYDVAGELGRGGMAVVYLAHDIEADRKVAIKVLSPVLEHDPEAVKRFRQDAQTAARLEHPHIIPIYRVESRGTPVFFVMKYVDGARRHPAAGWTVRRLGHAYGDRPGRPCAGLRPPQRGGSP